MPWANNNWERSLPILAERGYLIPAIGDMYIDCAEQLADSIRQFHPTANITILTKEQLPYGDLGGYANDWQVFAASPYRQTIKLEADMIAADPVDHWWTMFEHRDVVVSTGCRDFYGNPGRSRYYRKLFDANTLPDVYNAVTYWRVSKTAQEFFQLVKQIFEHWDQYKTLLKFPDEQATTDVVYAMAAQIMGPETVTLPVGFGPQIVHMKRHIIPTRTNDWTKELVWENTNPGLRINTIAQTGFVHYHVKNWRIQ
jgi:hypothetical protein